MITIYSLEGCPFSIAAEKLVASKLPASKYDINRVSHDEKSKYKKLHSYNTFPQVFVGNELIGGYNELVKYLKP